MPIYEYQCPECGREQEVFHLPGKGRKAVRCPECGKRMKRLISPSAFILKGSGWYVTDYPSKSRKEGIESEKKATKEKKEPADKGKKKSPAPSSKSSGTKAKGRKNS